MQHLGQILQQQIETNHLKKRDVATAAEISLNYLSVLYKKRTFDCQLWERLCIATGLNPCIAFANTQMPPKNYSDISAQTVVGPATVTIGSEQQAYLDLLAEKERMIQFLIAASGLKIGTPAEQSPQNEHI